MKKTITASILAFLFSGHGFILLATPAGETPSGVASNDPCPEVEAAITGTLWSFSAWWAIRKKADTS
jgi:hypothetical protein